MPYGKEYGESEGGEVTLDTYGNEYDDDYYSNFLASKKRYEPEVVQSVDSYTKFDKYEDPTVFHNYKSKMHDHKVHIPDNYGYDHVYGFDTSEMFFMQEEYEHHQRIKAHMVVALEAFQDALYFLNRKLAENENGILMNNMNIKAHQ